MTLGAETTDLGPISNECFRNGIEKAFASAIHDYELSGIVSENIAVIPI